MRYIAFDILFNYMTLRAIGKVPAIYPSHFGKDTGR